MIGDDREYWTVVIGFMLLIVLSLLLFAVVATYGEMRTFNKFSKTKATFWDAAFSQLRVLSD